MHGGGKELLVVDDAVPVHVNVVHDGLDLLQRHIGALFAQPAVRVKVRVRVEVGVGVGMGAGGWSGGGGEGEGEGEGGAVRERSRVRSRVRERERVRERYRGGTTASVTTVQIKCLS